MRQAGRIAAVAGLSTLLMASTAFAGGFALREQSAEGLGSAFAGMAAGSGGPSSMFWNPATMTEHADLGLWSESNVSLIIPDSQADDGGPFPGVTAPGFNDSGNIGRTTPLPASYWQYGVNDRLVFGVSLNTPFGLTTNADNWIGSPHGDKSKVMTMTLTPSVAYKLTDQLSIGAGLQAEYMSVDLTSRTPTGTKFFDVDGNDIDVGFTAGVLFQPTPSTDIGLGFRSSVKHKLKGDGFILGRFDGDITADFSTPELLSIGIRQRITDDLTLMAGAEWANWSRFEELNIKADPSDTTIGVTVEDWEDSWFLSAGAEFAFNEQLLLRAGVAYEKSPVPDATRTPRVPDNDRFWVAAGASYAFNQNNTLTLAYSHIFMKDGDINLAASGTLPALSASFDQSIDIISASFRHDW